MSTGTGEGLTTPKCNDTVSFFFSKCRHNHPQMYWFLALIYSYFSLLHKETSPEVFKTPHGYNTPTSSSSSTPGGTTQGFDETGTPKQKTPQENQRILMSRQRARSGQPTKTLLRTCQSRKSYILSWMKSLSTVFQLILKLVTMIGSGFSFSRVQYPQANLR